MKFIILISCLIVAAYADPQSDFYAQAKAKLMAAGQECRPIAGATDDDINKIMAREVPATSTGKCFLACVNKKLKFMNDDGSLSKEAAEKFVASFKEVNADLGKQLEEACNLCFGKVTQGGDECQTAYDMTVCLEGEKKARGIPNLLA